LQASPAQSGSNEAKTEKIGEVNSEKDSTKYSGKENLKSPSENLSEAGDSDLDDGQPQVLVEGITGFSSEYVILVSSDFHEFIVKRAVAYMSPTLKRILKMRNKTAKPRTVSEVLVNYP
jgi:Skp1 family, tetramerisation domain